MCVLLGAGRGYDSRRFMDGALGIACRAATPPHVVPLAASATTSAVAACSTSTSVNRTTRTALSCLKTPLCPRVHVLLLWQSREIQTQFRLLSVLVLFPADDRRTSYGHLRDCQTTVTHSHKERDEKIGEKEFFYLFDCCPPCMESAADCTEPMRSIASLERHLKAF